MDVLDGVQGVCVWHVYFYILSCTIVWKFCQDISMCQISGDLNFHCICYSIDFIPTSQQVSRENEGKNPDVCRERKHSQLTQL